MVIPHDKVEGELRGAGYAEQHVAADEHRDGLRSGAYDTANDSEDAAADEPVAAAENVRQTADRGQADGQRGVVYERDPGVARVGPDVFVDMPQDWRRVTLCNSVSLIFRSPCIVILRTYESRDTRPETDASREHGADKEAARVIALG